MALKSNQIVSSRMSDEMIDLNVRVPAHIFYTVRGHNEIDFDLALVSAENHGRALVHGWGQKLPDSAAIDKADKKTGAIIPERERDQTKYERMSALADRLMTGTTEWTRKGSSGGARSIVVEAFARHNACSYEQANERINRRAAAAGRTRAEQLAVYKDLLADDVRAIEAERAVRVPAFDADEELANMAEDA